MSFRELQSFINSPELKAGELMRGALGLKMAEVEVYCALAGLGLTTVQEVSERLGKSRPTTQRLLQSIVEKGIASREEELIGLGGYRFVYRAVSPLKLKENIRKMLDQWYSKMIIELEDLPRKIEEMGYPRRFSRLQDNGRAPKE
jgi:predicted transcriptional regulator